MIGAVGAVVVVRCELLLLKKSWDGKRGIEGHAGEVFVLLSMHG